MVSIIIVYSALQRMSTSCYSISLYDCPNGDIYTASREDCIDISTGICALQWNLTINYGYGDRMRNC